MVNHGTVRSIVKPKEFVIDEYSVWVHTNITEINENLGEESEFIGYQYDCVQYDKNEYIKQLSEENTNLMLAIAEIYESINGGSEV